jgi:hypothetical protein
MGQPIQINGDSHLLESPRFPRAGKLDPVFRVFVSDFIEDAKAFCSRRSVGSLSGRSVGTDPFLARARYNRS